MIFVGYERGSKAYRAYDPLTGRVTITHEIVFDKSTQWWCTRVAMRLTVVITMTPSQ
jgi:hypothetical protein